MSLAERSRDRRARMVVNHAASHAEAEAWDLEFWQSMTPEERLSALVTMRRELKLVEESRRQADSRQSQI